MDPVTIVAALFVVAVVGNAYRSELGRLVTHLRTRRSAAGGTRHLRAVPGPRPARPPAGAGRLGRPVTPPRRSVFRRSRLVAWVVDRLVAVRDWLGEWWLATGLDEVQHTTAARPLGRPRPVTVPVPVAPDAPSGPAGPTVEDPPPPRPVPGPDGAPPVRRPSVQPPPVQAGDPPAPPVTAPPTEEEPVPDPTVRPETPSGPRPSPSFTSRNGGAAPFAGMEVRDIPSLIEHWRRMAATGRALQESGISIGLTGALATLGTDAIEEAERTASRLTVEFRQLLAGAEGASRDANAVRVEKLKTA